MVLKRWVAPELYDVVAVLEQIAADAGEAQEALRTIPSDFLKEARVCLNSLEYERVGTSDWDYFVGADLL